MYARYTEYLKDLMDNEHTMAALNEALSTYPLYEPKDKKYDLIPTREELNKKILNHYKYREIGFETPGRFLDELKITMEEIMPYYNELFKTIEIMANIENPFDTVDMVEEFEQTTKGNNKNNGITNSVGKGTSKNNQKTNGKTIDSDTPQDSLQIGTKNIDQVDYASNAGWNENIAEGGSEHNEKNTTTSGGTSEHETVMHYKHTRKGAQGVSQFGQDITVFRQSIHDYELEIVNHERIAELFINVY